MDSLKRRCPLRPSCRHLLASDSQVVLGCLVRGRSSSKNLNHLLRTLLPTLLSCDGYICAQYVPTGINVADDPTRARACRKPTCCEEDWISAISTGDCSGLDDRLQQAGISDFQVARLPLPPSAVSFSPWLPRVRCPPAALKLLLILPESQFVFPPGVDRAQCLRYKGHLDLFSGSRASARALAAESGQWVLTYDIKHSPDEDLLSGPVQESLEAMVRAGCFLSAAGGLVCSSFSRAVRPPVRDKAHPGGLAGISLNMRAKVETGNTMSRWFASFILLVHSLGLVWWVENPAGSFLWMQDEWLELRRATAADFFTVDYCRFGTPYRKRTRFLTNSVLAAVKLLCDCGRPHIRLVGYSKVHRCSWTRVAEPYPVGLSRFLARGICESLKPPERRVLLDSAECAATEELEKRRTLDPGSGETALPAFPIWSWLTRCSQLLGCSKLRSLPSLTDGCKRIWAKLLSVALLCYRNCSWFFSGHLVTSYTRKGRLCTSSDILLCIFSRAFLENVLLWLLRGIFSLDGRLQNRSLTDRPSRNES